MEATRVMRGRALRRRLAGSAPLSLRAELLLVGSAFLCGCVLAGLLFVGVWRHTATEGAQARANQLSAQRRLAASARELKAAKTQLASTRAILARVSRQRRQALATVARTQRADRLLRRTLSPRLQGLRDTASTLARQSSALQSEIHALETYARDPGAAGLDLGYLVTQTQYLESSAQAAASTAAGLAQHARDAQAAATR